MSQKQPHHTKSKTGAPVKTVWAKPTIPTATDTKQLSLTKTLEQKWKIHDAKKKEDERIRILKEAKAKRDKEIAEAKAKEEKIKADKEKKTKEKNDKLTKLKEIREHSNP